MSSRWNRKVLVALACLVVGFGLAEFSLRAYARLHPPAPLFQPDPILGFRMVPGVHWPGTPGQFHVNRQGLRSDEIPGEKAPGELRLLFLGDSVTVALAQRVRQTFVEQCGAELRRIHGHGPVRVINGGMDGYATVHMLALLDEVGPLYRPDVVVVTLYPVETLQYIEPPWDQAWKYAVRSALYRSRVIQQAMLLLRWTDGFNRWPADVPYPSGTNESLLANLDAFEQMSARLGCKMLFVMEASGPDAPLRPGLPGPRPRPPEEVSRGIRARTDGRGNPALWLDDNPDFASLGGAGLEEDGRHLSVRGHEMLGRIVARELVKRGWVPGASAAP